MLRLQQHSEFVKVMQNRQKVSSRNLVVHYRLRTYDDKQMKAPENRLGLAVAKTVGGAVVRNKVKRRFRVLAREFEQSLPSGVDIVMRALPSSATVTFSELSGEVHKNFLRIARNFQTSHDMGQIHHSHDRGPTVPDASLKGQMA